MAIIYPCKDCTARYIGCHQSCMKYIDCVLKAEDLRAQKLREKRDYDTLFDAMARMKKRRNKNA